MDKDFLDDLIPAQDAVETEQVEAAPEPAPEPEAGSDGPQRDDKGRFAAKGVEPEDTQEAVPPTDKLPKEDYKAIREEREKRQAAEARLAALEQQLQELQQPAAPPPSIWDDDQAALQHSQQQAVSQATYMARLDMSEMLAAQAHDDFDAMKAKFIELMSLNPALQQEALQAKHPWEKAYQIAKNATTAAELGATNVSELRAKIEAELREEMAKSQPAPQPAIPTSLADAQSSRSAGQGVPTLTLQDILGR